jgi:ligand-binding SRPBCC domain-containing protein
MSWVTEITHVKDQEYFVDIQRYGPYALWHHRHQFDVVDGGVMMRDTLHYRLPFGILGKLVDWLFVRNKVMSIFRHRLLVMEKKFGRLELI